MPQPAAPFFAEGLCQLAHFLDCHIHLRMGAVGGDGLLQHLRALDGREATLLMLFQPAAHLRHSPKSHVERRKNAVEVVRAVLQVVHEGVVQLLVAQPGNALRVAVLADDLPHEVEGGDFPLEIPVPRLFVLDEYEVVGQLPHTHVAGVLANLSQLHSCLLSLKW